MSENNELAIAALGADIELSVDRYVQFASDGLSIRDYFAAKAMQGMLSDPTVACDGVRLACIAYAHADAMLAERDK